MKTKFHPGMYIREALEEMSKRVNLDLGYLDSLLSEQTCITEDAAEKIGAFFDINPTTWVNLQRAFDNE